MSVTSNKIRKIFLLTGLLFLTGCGGKKDAAKEASPESIQAAVDDQLDEGRLEAANEEDVTFSTEFETGEGVSGEPGDETAGQEAVTLQEPADVSIIMVGDLLLHDNISWQGQQADGSFNYDFLFSHVKDDIEGADCAVVNNELIYGGNEKGIQNYPCFNVRTELGDSVVRAGFDVVLHASNHVLDQGIDGIENTLDFWQANHPEIGVLGIHDSPEASEEIYVFEKDGFRIAMLNYTFSLNGFYLDPAYDHMIDQLGDAWEEEIRTDIERAKELADCVVVFPHWGTEYYLGSDDFQHKWAQRFADWGVTLVLGDHPHVVEPVEWYTGEAGNEMLCYYSVGNFVSSQTGAESMLGIMAKVTLHKDELGSVTVSEYGIEPLVTQRGNFTVYRLSDYTDELARSSTILNYDSRFSVSFMKDVTRQVFGELYREEK